MKKIAHLVIAIIVIASLCWQCKPKPPKAIQNNQTTGFKKNQYRKEVGKFPESEYACDLSPLEALKKHVPNTKNTHVKIIDINAPNGCKSWTDCGINNKKYRHFLIMPGDYRKWGILKIRTSGNAEQPKIISYYNPKLDKPYAEKLPINTPLSPQHHVILEAFDIVEADHWILNGLTFSGNSEKNKRGKVGGRYSRFAVYANHNIINRCLFEGVVNHPSNIRISFSDYNCIQNSIVRNLIGDDQVGILLKGEKSRAIGNRIINNEIYDCNDGIQLTYSTSFAPNGYLSGTIIENNDIYLTPKAYSKQKNGFACAENAIDIKMGGESAKPEDIVLILKNRIWGFRPTDTNCGGSGSLGRGIGLHLQANNIILKDNICFDLPGGINVSNKNLANTHVAVLNNLFFDIKKFDKKRKFAPAISAGADVDVYYNTIKGAQTSLLIPSKKISRVQCNTIIGVPQNIIWQKTKNSRSALNAWYACKIDERGVHSHNSRLNIVDNRSNVDKFEDFTFYRKRWTRPEKIVVKNVFPGNQKQISRLSQTDNHCGEGGEGNRWWAKCLKERAPMN